MSIAWNEKKHNYFFLFRIKTNSTDGEYLYVPLEIEVSSVPGLYSTQVTDFMLWYLANILYWN